MKKPLITLLAISALPSLASTVFTCPDDLKTNCKYWFDFDGTTAPITSWDANGTPNRGPAWSENFGYANGQNYGTISGVNDNGNTPYQNLSGFNGTGFTLNFDIKNVSVQNWKDILSFSTSSGNIKFEATGNSKELAIYGPVGLNNIPIREQITSNDWSTVTISGGTSGLFVYLNGEIIASNTSTEAIDVLTSLNITGIQFGKNWAGQGVEQRPITYADIDNIGIWNTQLTEKQIKSLQSIPEPATATLSLLGLTTLLLRRRRKV